MTKTDWRVISFKVGGSEYWFVYRLKNVGTPDQTGNRIYKGGQFDSEQDAQDYADLLNTYGEHGERWKEVT